MTGKHYHHIAIRLLHTLAFGLVFLFALSPAPVSAQVQTNSPVSASVQPARVTVGDTIAYTVTVEISGSGQPSVAVPVIPASTGLSNPEFVRNESSYQTFSVNGNMRQSQQITYIYTIRTSKEGRFTIPPANVTLNGQLYETNSTQVTVQALPETRDIPDEIKDMVVPPATNNNEVKRKLTGGLFILPVISNMTPYNGEQIQVAYHLVVLPEALQEAGLQPQVNLNDVAIPQLSEFIAEELYAFPPELKFNERDIGGKVYLVAPIYEAAIASTRSGDLTLEPFKVGMQFRSRVQQSRTGHPFDDDPFFSMSPFGRAGNIVSVVAQSPAITLKVKPVPQAGKPAHYSGAVGHFDISAQVDKKAARAYDDTIQLEITIEGEGNTESLSAPQLPDMPAFTVLGNPDEKVGGRKDPKTDRFISRKTFTYTLRPTVAGDQVIPPVPLAAFDPEKEVFADIATEPITIAVEPGSRPQLSQAPAPTAETSDDTPDEPVVEESDYRFIHLDSLTSPNPFLQLFSGKTVYLAFLAPAILALGCGVVSFGRTALADSRSRRPVLSAGALSAAHFDEARSALAANDAQTAFQQIAEAIRQYYSAAFDLPIGEITNLTIEENLPQRGVAPELITESVGILEQCDAARYSPAGSSAASAGQTLDGAEKLIASLKEHLKA